MPPLAGRDDAWIQREVAGEIAMESSLAGCEVVGFLTGIKGITNELKIGTT